MEVSKSRSIGYSYRMIPQTYFDVVIWEFSGVLYDICDISSYKS